MAASAREGIVVLAVGLAAFMLTGIDGLGTHRRSGGWHGGTWGGESRGRLGLSVVSVETILYPSKYGVE